MSGSKPIVIIGSINTDLVTRTDRLPRTGETVLGSNFSIYPGGKGANQAVAIARLGYPVRMIGRVGSDWFGREARVHLGRAGVDTELVETVEGASGVAAICVSAAGENTIVVSSGANAMLTPDVIDRHVSQIRQASVVLTQLEIPLETVANLTAICTHEGIPLILDPAPATTLPSGFFRHVTWLTPNQTEALFYTEDSGSESEFDPRSAAGELLRKGVQGVVLKLGAEGVFVADKDGNTHALPAFNVRAVDTTAAGDAFNGGFAVARVRGMSVIESARFASAVAAISVTRHGAQPSMPGFQEVEEFVAEQTTRAL